MITLRVREGEKTFIDLHSRIRFVYNNIVELPSKQTRTQIVFRNWIINDFFFLFDCYFLKSEQKKTQLLHVKWQRLGHISLEDCLPYSCESHKKEWKQEVRPVANGQIAKCPNGQCHFYACVYFCWNAFVVIAKSRRSQKVNTVEIWWKNIRKKKEIKQNKSLFDQWILLLPYSVEATTLRSAFSEDKK